VKNENGIKIIDNDLKGEYEKLGKTITLEKILSIGREDGKEEELLYGMWDLAVNYKGNIYVVERKNKCVKVFDSKGKFLFKIGRGGDGPGEFREPVRIFSAPNNDVFILDQNGIISRFNDKGKFIFSFKTKSSPNDFVVDSHGNFYVNENYYADKKIWVYDKKGNQVKSFGDVVKGKNGSETGFLNRGVMAVDKDDNIYIAYNQPFKIEKYSNEGKLISVISRKTPFKITEPDFKEEKKDRGLVVKMNSASKLAADLFVNNGKIYFLLKTDQGAFSHAGSLDVFDLNGKFLFQAAFNSNDIRAISVDDKGNIYAIDESLGFAVPEISKRTGKTIRLPQIIKYKVNIE